MPLRPTLSKHQRKLAIGLENRSCLRTCRHIPRVLGARHYAVVGTTTYVGEPPAAPTTPPPSRFPPSSSISTDAPSAFDARVLYELRRRAIVPGLEGKAPAHHDLPELIAQYNDNSGHTLEVSLPYESRPSADRRTTYDHKGEHAVAMVVHAAQSGLDQKLTYCSGFALNAPGRSEDQAVFVTCAHTFEEIRHHPILGASRQAVLPQTSSSPNAHTPSVSGSFLVTGDSTHPVFSPVSSVLSALHRSDLLLLSAATRKGLHTLPVSPYPARPGTAIRAHFVRDSLPEDAEGWKPWVGGMWSKWVRGTVTGYRDMAGREADPGTYDSLAHLYFEPLPTPGSSGGPIVDEETGAVIGVVLGSQLQNRVEGVRGWGVPAETIFEMFRLPGLNLPN